MTEYTLKESLDAIHYDIKSRFIYKKDIEVWGTMDHWERYDQIPKTGKIYGDCDCFAMACRRECRRLTIPSRLVIVLTENKEGHMILSVNEYCLDNRQKSVVYKSYLDKIYTWIAISGYEKGDRWHILND